MNEVLIAALVIGGMGAILGIGLSYASKVFAVTVDEKVVMVREALPGANCGGCGYAGCDGYAEAVVLGEAKTNACSVGGDSTSLAISSILGVEPAGVSRRNARVMCGGNCSVSREKYLYEGIEDCVAASQLFAGHKACSYGCLGHGNCVAACQFGAIEIVGGVASIIEDKCLACEQCIAACPKHLIEMVPSEKKYSVICKSKDKGPVTKKNCDTGCIGCMRCVKACAFEAITVVDNLAKIDTEKCTNCGECEKVCPTKSIRKVRFLDYVLPPCFENDEYSNEN